MERAAFTHPGKHYYIKESSFYPPPSPIQRPRIPIWVVGAWPRMRSMRRALRYDGLIPATVESNGTVRNATPDEVHQMKKFIEANRSGKDSYDIVVEGRTQPDDPSKVAELVRPWSEAGATWWMATSWGSMDKPELMKVFRKRILNGPPSQIEHARTV